MDNLGNYITVKQARKFLSERIKYKASKRDLFELAARGDIRLCAWFDGVVAEFKVKYPEPERAGVIQFRLKCYITIPTKAISPLGGVFSFESIEPFEVIHPYENYRAPKEYQFPNNNPLPRIPGNHFWAKYSGQAGTGEKIKCIKFEVDSDQVVIPQQDVLDFIKSKETEQLEPQVTKSKNTKTKKLRRDCLDPAIDQAISAAGNDEYADVYLQLKEMALNEFRPFIGATNNGSLCYTNDNDDHAELSKAALRQRLKRRRKKSTTNAK